MLTIHGVPISVHTRKVILAAILKGLDYRVEPVVPFQPPAGWAELSPTGLIPAIDDDGFLLADSTAICLYLERKTPAPALLPADAEDYARALWFDAYAGGTVFRHVVHGLFFNKVIRPGILGEPGDTAAIEAILADAAPRAFGYLESQVAGRYLAGERLSLADLAVGSNLVNFRYLGLAIDIGRYPRLAAYAERLLDEPAFRTALAAEAPFAAQMGLDRSFLAQAAPA